MLHTHLKKIKHTKQKELQSERQKSMLYNCHISSMKEMLRFPGRINKLPEFLWIKCKLFIIAINYLLIKKKKLLYGNYCPLIQKIISIGTLK